MNKLLHLALLIPLITFAPQPAQCKTSNLPPLCGEWEGKVETEGIELAGTLHLFPDGEAYQGSLIAQGKGGTSKHYLTGKFDKAKKHFVFHDTKVELVFGQSDWKPAVMTEYILRLSGDHKKLTGNCHQFARPETINLNFTKIADISADQILEKASETISQAPVPAEQDAPAPAQSHPDPNNLEALAIEVRKASATYSGAADYFDRVSNELARWPKNKLPLKVYLTPADDIHNYRDTYRQAIISSFNDWIKASNYRLSWRLVTKKADANIVCKWVSKPGELPVHKHREQGITNTLTFHSSNNDELWIEKAEITICTSNISTHRALKNDDVFNVSRHEVGHALGILGHSNSKTDIMYPTMSKKLMSVSMRDTGTVNHLYAAYSMTPWE